MTSEQSLAMIGRKTTLAGLGVALLASPGLARVVPEGEKHAPHSVIIQELTSVGDASLRGVAQLGDAIVWVSGSNGLVRRSLDGGESWKNTAPPETEGLDFRDIEILDSQTVLLMSVGTGDSSRIYKTIDGGESWRLTLRNAVDGAFFNGFDFWDSEAGVLTSDSSDGRLRLLRTTDGGDTWSRIGAKTLPELEDGEAGFAASGTGIVTRNGEVWVATGGGASRIFHSSDQGESWQVFEAPLPHGQPSSGIFSIAFLDPQTGVMVGGDYQDPETDTGNIAWTENGGRTWHLAHREVPISQKACARFLGPELVLAVGRNGLVVSRDGGRSWQPLDGPPFYAFDFDASSGIGYLVGSEGRVGRLVVHE